MFVKYWHFAVGSYNITVEDRPLAGRWRLCNEAQWLVPGTWCDD